MKFLIDGLTTMAVTRTLPQMDSAYFRRHAISSVRIACSPFSLHRSFGWAVLVALFRFPFFCSSGSCLLFHYFVTLSYAPAAFLSLTSPPSVLLPRCVDILNCFYVVVLIAG